MALSLSQSDAQIRKRVVRLVLKGRTGDRVTDDGTPRFSANDTIVENGIALQRRTVILLTKGCSIPTCTMCPFTNYNHFGSDTAPSSPEEQLKRDFDRSPPIEIDVVSIYNDGSFFANSEITDSQRLRIAEIIRQHRIPHIVVESLPQFIKSDAVSRFSETANANLTIGIGLQSADEFIRKVCVGTSFSKLQFEKAVSISKQLGVRVKPYVMIKPPFLSDSEALIDVKRAARYLVSIGLDNVTLCPTRIAPNTLVEKLHGSGAYDVPHPFTVLAALRASLELVDARIALVNLTAEDFSSVTSVSKRTDEAHIVLAALKSFSISGDRTHLVLPHRYETAYAEHCAELDGQSEADVRARTLKLLDDLESSQR